MNTEPPPDHSTAEIEELIERSSFGAPDARALSDRTSTEIARSILGRVAGISDRTATEAPEQADYQPAGIPAHWRPEASSNPTSFAETAGEAQAEGMNLATDLSPMAAFRERVLEEWAARSRERQDIESEQDSEGEQDSGMLGGALSELRDLLGAGSLVRPYARTGGRTHTYEDFPVEALILTTERGRAAENVEVPEHRAICELCTQPRALLEVGARVQLPLGVIRVLVGDLLRLGLVDIQRPSLVDGRPSIELMNRVLRELHRKL
ncbi:DUF742 domain-containing protein [Amycolatopsis japonica]